MRFVSCGNRKHGKVGSKSKSKSKFLRKRGSKRDKNNPENRPLLSDEKETEASNAGLSQLTESELEEEAVEPVIVNINRFESTDKYEYESEDEYHCFRAKKGYYISKVKSGRRNVIWVKGEGEICEQVVVIVTEQDGRDLSIHIKGSCTRKFRKRRGDAAWEEGPFPKCNKTYKLADLAYNFYHSLYRILSKVGSSKRYSHGTLRAIMDLTSSATAMLNVSMNFRIGEKKSETEEWVRMLTFAHKFVKCDTEILKMFDRRSFLKEFEESIEILEGFTKEMNKLIEKIEGGDHSDSSSEPDDQLDKPEEPERYELEIESDDDDKRSTSTEIEEIEKRAGQYITIDEYRESENDSGENDSGENENGENENGENENGENENEEKGGENESEETNVEISKVELGSIETGSDHEPEKPEPDKPEEPKRIEAKIEDECDTDEPEPQEPEVYELEIESDSSDDNLHDELDEDDVSIVELETDEENEKEQNHDEKTPLLIKAKEERKEPDGKEECDSDEDTISCCSFLFKRRKSKK